MATLPVPSIEIIWAANLFLLHWNPNHPESEGGVAEGGEGLTVQFDEGCNSATDIPLTKVTTLR